VLDRWLESKECGCEAVERRINGQKQRVNGQKKNCELKKEKCEECMQEDFAVLIGSSAVLHDRK
jgi:hypothetical protein